MNKLQLDLTDLRVDTFSTDARAGTRGTVYGRTAVLTENCETDLCEPSTRDIQCISGDTCDAFTCDDRCKTIDTCFNSCQATVCSTCDLSDCFNRC